MRSEIEEIIKRAESAAKIKVCERDLERILSACLTTQNFWRIVDLSDVSFVVVAHVLKQLKARDYINVTENKIALTSAGNRLAETLGCSRIRELSCERCAGKGIDIEKLNEISRGIAEKFRELQKNRPEPKMEYDQGHLTCESTLARVALAIARGDVERKKILVLGDDDLVSVALALTALPKEVVVLDIDGRLIEFISSIAKRENLRITALKLDLTQPLTENMLHSFDTFITDPPDTLYALKLFLLRGMSALKGEGCGGYFGVTRRESSLRKWAELQKILLRYNAVITDIIHNFSEYSNWGYMDKTEMFELAPVKELPKDIWYRSCLFRIELLDKVEWNAPAEREGVYTDEEYIGSTSAVKGGG